MTNRPVVTIKLASTSDELLQCYVLRAAVFMGEQQCPYWEEFDGNDYSASHLMLYVDGEPAASMRVRWFSGFAKLERAIILKRYRSMGLFVPFVEWARDFAAEGLPEGLPAWPEAAVGDLRAQGFRKVNDARSISPTTSTARSPATSMSPRDPAVGLHRPDGAEPSGRPARTGRVFWKN